MAPETRVRSQWLPMLLAYAESRGVESAATRARHALPPGTPPTASATTTPAELLEATEAVAASLDDPHLGVSVALWLPQGVYRVAEYAARSAPTLGDAFRCVATVAPLVNDRLRITHVDEGPHVRLVHWVEGEPRSLGRHWNVFGLAILVRLAHELAGEPVVPSRVDFVHPPPAEGGEHPLFGRDVRHGCERNAVVLPGSVRARRAASAEAGLHAILDDLSRERLAEAAPDDVVTRTRIAIHRAFERGVPDIASIARALGMSTRTLERRLAERGTTFEAVRDAFRRDLADFLVLHQREALPEVARRTGFKSVEGLRAAFVRWAGGSG